MTFKLPPLIYADLYTRFDAPIADLDCGQYCAPFNKTRRQGESRGPFCCDTQHAVPTVYYDEWQYLIANTDLWRPWQGRTPAETRRVQEETPSNMLLVECLGYQHCQRKFRSLTCRAFPFFPYLTRDNWFIGMTYYWQYEYACWVISNLQVVNSLYREQFFAVFDELFERYPLEREGYRLLSSSMRRVFSRWGRAVPILHRNGNAYKVTPKNGRLRRVDAETFPKYGVYKTENDVKYI